MMDALTIPGRTPQAPTMRGNEMLQSIFGALPESHMLQALSAVGIQVKDPQEHLAPDDAMNKVASWNQRRVELKGTDHRGPVWDKNKVIEVKKAMPRGEEPPYMHPDYDSHLSELNVAQNAPGGF